MPPKRLGDPRAGLGEAIHIFRRNGRILDSGDRADRVVHLLEDVDVEVADIAGNEEADDLPPPVRQPLVAARPAAEDQAHDLGVVALANDIAARLRLMNGIAADGLKRRTVFRG